MNNSFGIVLTTYIGDFHFTKGLLASIKKYMPEMPICIIQDGNFSMDEVLNTYNITHVIKKENIKNEFLRETCLGSRCSNLVAFWEGPFEKFLYLDSDLVLWGDILKHIKIDDYDFIHNEPHEPYTDAICRYQYFDNKRIFDHTEHFDWEGCHFFNSGVFISKKAPFDFTEFEELTRLSRIDKTLMPTETQGILNVLVFRDKQKGKLKVGEAHLQTIVPVMDRKVLETTFTIDNNTPVVKKDTILHWAGTKPLMTNQSLVFTKPETYFRKLHLKNIGSIWYYMPSIYFYYEEYLSILNRYHHGSVLYYIKSKLKRLF